METNYESNVVEHLGNYNPINIIYAYTHDFNTGIIACHEPLRQSLDRFLAHLMGSEPIHVFTNIKEYETVAAHLNILTFYYFKTDEKPIELYLKILAEQRINIVSELQNASRLPTDDEARKYLVDLNKRLRIHFEQFPHFHDNPVRLRGQRGRLRKSKNIPPRKIIWP